MTGIMGSRSPDVQCKVNHIWDKQVYA